MPCSKRFVTIIPLWLPHYPGGLDLSVVKALKKISAPTIDRVLKHTRKKHKRVNISTTKPGTLLRKQIPIKTNQWDEFRPGFLEADTVAHCGGRSEGEYVNTVDFVDIATGWTEQRAVWGKGETSVLEQIKNVEESLPFPMLGFDSDNGGEFLNYHLLRHFTDNRKAPIQFTRSRAYKKDDNAHIEQKNYTHVRQKLGYLRFEDQKMVDLLNDLYKNEWRLYHNFFLPSVKLIEKERIRSKIIKKHDQPKTPYQRVMKANSFDVLRSTKQKLTNQLKSLNPFQLKNIIDTKIKNILKLAS
jgi:5S rRNA maturation endonuclease (ribonuclease M5)